MIEELVGEFFAESFTDLSGNSLRYLRDTNGLQEITESSGRKNRSQGRNGLIEQLGLACEKVKTRRQALNEVKDRAGIPRSQQFDRQWEVGDDYSRHGHKNYVVSKNKGSHGRYYEYTDQNGHKRVIADHTNAGKLHTHAGKPKQGADPRTYDFKQNRYQKIIGPENNHHIYYE